MLRLHIKIICWRFHIKTTSTFWDKPWYKRTWDMWKVCLQTFRSNRICLKKLAYFLKNLQTSRTNNSKVLRNKNANFSGYLYERKNIGRFSNLHKRTFNTDIYRVCLNCCYCYCYLMLIFQLKLKTFVKITVVVPKSSSGFRSSAIMKGK